MAKNKQTFVSREGKVHEVEDDGAGLREKPNPTRPGLNLVIAHPKCGTITRYKIEDTMKIIQSGEGRSVTIETSCDKCGEPISVSLLRVEQGN